MEHNRRDRFSTWNKEFLFGNQKHLSTQYELLAVSFPWCASKVCTGLVFLYTYRELESTLWYYTLWSVSLGALSKYLLKVALVFSFEQFFSFAPLNVDGDYRVHPQHDLHVTGVCPVTPWSLS